ncbi:Abcc3 [Symbiodinium sp. CCMP2456]|nr:Abcc3 [Symbiodinium sp. CCMP2456]
MAADAAEGAEHPLERAHFWSVASISWLTPLARKAVKGKLEVHDVWEAPAGQTVDTAVHRFKLAWEVEQQRKTPSVARAMIRANAGRVAASGSLLLLFISVQLAQPLLIQSLVSFLNTPAAAPGEGWLMASLIFMSALASSVLVSEFFRHGFVLGVLSRTAAMSAIYEKAINMSVLARSGGSTGKTTNLMAVDAEKFAMASQVFHFLWISPVMMICCGIVMAFRIGPAGFIGLAFLFVTVPVQHLLAKKGGQIRVKALAFTDERMKFVTEVVQGIRVAKLYAWEAAIFQYVASVRRRECAKLCASLLMKIAVREGLLLVAPAVALGLILAGKMWQDGELELSEAIMILGLLNTLRFPMNLLALSFATTQDCLVAAKRISAFLLLEESRRRAEAPRNDPEYSADAAHAAFAEGVVCCWDPTLAFRLRITSCRLVRGSRVAILGPVGSGKTSFLSMLLDEMHLLQGSSFLDGRVAYLAQVPWIQNASLRANILFGLPMDEDIYDQTLEAAALQTDLEALLDGDLTDIGERGINLSGGQKARVGLARCLYAAATRNADVVILDSPFAALDTLTAQTVVEGLIRMTSGCTLVCAVSAHTHLLRNFERILIMSDGAILADGSPEELRQQVGNLPHAGTEPTQTKPIESMKSPSKAPRDASRRLMRADTVAQTFPLTALGKWLGGPGGCSQRGLLIGVPICLIFLAGQGCRVITDVSLTEWAAGQSEFSTSLVLLAVLVVLSVLRITFCALASFRAARLLHNDMFWRLLRAPVTTYFDVVTTGEICNKLSKDLEFTDTQLPELLTQFLSNTSLLFIIFGLTIFAVPWFAAILCLLSTVFVMVAVQSGYLLRALQRFESASKSPIYTSFSETLSGLQTICAWGHQERFHEAHTKIMRQNLRFFHAASMSDIWLQFRLELLTVFIIGSFTFLAVGLRSSIDGNTVGLALVYAIQMTAMFQRCTKLAILIGQMLTACERVLSFEKAPQEPDLVQPQDIKLHEWPQGSIAFNDVSVQYRDGDLVLKDVCFSANAGTRVGICGRSGAGKSSIVMALFRMVDPCGGRIMIDGIDIATVGVHTLRQNLAIIPQEPIVFSGSLRSNLDPFRRVLDDTVLTGALEQVGLQGLVKEAGLEMAIAEQGGNLSQGQRQLLCIARAFVRKNRIMVLDEATSSVDEQTDALIKNVLQAHWSQGHQQCTVLTVAHRLSTILDYDRILVLNKGEVVEFDAPAELLSRPGGSELVVANGYRSEPRLPEPWKSWVLAALEVAAQAAQDSQIKWIALEIMRDRAHSILQKAVFQGLRNISIVCGEAAQTLESLFPSSSISHIFINFPEPPFVSGDEAAESSFHMMTEHLFVEMDRVLRNGCRITILSDNARYMRTVAKTVASLASAQRVRLASAGAKQLWGRGECPEHETVHGVELYQGWPEASCGHAVKASSYFDTLWAMGKRVDRFYMVLRSSERQEAQLHKRQEIDQSAKVPWFGMWDVLAFSIDAVSCVAAVMSAAAAEELVKKAEQKMKGGGGLWGYLSGGPKYDEAIEIYQQAANQYKMAKMWQEAGNCFVQCAFCAEKSGSQSDQANYLSEAGNVLKKVSTQLAVEQLEQAVSIYSAGGRFQQAGKLLLSVAELYEAERLQHKECKVFYKRAAEMFELADHSESNFSKCNLKYAEFAAKDGELEEAIRIFESEGEKALGKTLLQFGAKEHFLNAGILHLVGPVASPPLEATRNDRSKHSMQSCC